MTLHKTIQNLPAIKARESIPAVKRKMQWVKTLLGSLVAIAGLLSPNYLGFPWQFGAALVGFGGFIASQQLVRDYLKAIPQALAAFTGRRDG